MAAGNDASVWMGNQRRIPAGGICVPIRTDLDLEEVVVGRKERGLKVVGWGGDRSQAEGP